MSDDWAFVRRGALKAFNAHFGKHVMPRLANLVRAEAVCVVANVETFEGAYDAVMSYANRHGAVLLSQQTIAELEDWVAMEVLAAIDVLETESVQ